MKPPILMDFPESFETERLLIRSPLPGDGPELHAAVRESIEELDAVAEGAQDRRWFGGQRAPGAGRGYVTEAVRGVTAFAFDALGARRVEIRCDSLNHPSVRVAQRAGFRLEGELHNNEVGTDGSARDTLIFALIPEHRSKPTSWNADKRGPKARSVLTRREAPCWLADYPPERSRT
jgi:Acetyltransferase (GNAT) domain